jgi:cell wall-associated NlpC family hydrolase
MPDNRTSRLMLAYLLAVPVIALAYVAFAVSRVWAAIRPGVATFLGATVIGTVYADEALKRAPATPMRIAAVLALAIALVGPGTAPTPASAATDGPAAVIAAARQYLGSPYRLGAEGPRVFDCSGLVYRMFADAGELPRIGGMRLLARGYLRWFTSRGWFTKDQSEARPGDLVVWDNGEHIGIYLGEGKTISAIVNPYGVKVHELGWIRNMKVTQFLLVQWGRGGGSPDPEPEPEPPTNPGDGGGDGPGTPGARPDVPAQDRGAGPGNGNNRGSRADDSTNPNASGGGADAAGRGVPEARPSANRGTQAMATGTLNMRDGADPNGRIIGWVSPGQKFRIIGRGNSPSGWLWYQVRTTSGKEGWLFSYWVREI